MNHHNNKIFISGAGSKEYEENFDNIFRSDPFLKIIYEVAKELTIKKENQDENSNK